jgi:hypothetical protein
MTKRITFRAKGQDEYLTEKPPSPAVHSVPDWYKKIPAEYKEMRQSLRNRSTVKKCMPFLDALTTGYMLTIPQEIEIHKTNGSINYYYGIPRFTFDGIPQPVISEDEHYRYAGMPIPDGYLKTVFRINLYPSIYTPKGYSSLITQPLNRYDLPFLALSGVVDTDKEHTFITATVFLREDFEGIIPAGTPILQVLPFKRENWTSEVLPPISRDEQHKALFNKFTHSNRFYQRFMWSKKTYK